MTAAYISERSRNSKQLKKYDLLYFSFLGGESYFFNYLNSCSFQRYRPLSVKDSSFFLTHPLDIGCPALSRKLWSKGEDNVGFSNTL